LRGDRVKTSGLSAKEKECRKKGDGGERRKTLERSGEGRRSSKVTEKVTGTIEGLGRG